MLVAGLFGSTRRKFFLLWSTVMPIQCKTQNFVRQPGPWRLLNFRLDDIKMRRRLTNLGTDYEVEFGWALLDLLVIISQIFHRILLPGLGPRQTVQVGHVLLLLFADERSGSSSICTNCSLLCRPTPGSFCWIASAGGIHFPESRVQSRGVQGPMPSASAAGITLQLASLLLPPEAAPRFDGDSAMRAVPSSKIRATGSKDPRFLLQSLRPQFFAILVARGPSNRCAEAVPCWVPKSAVQARVRGKARFLGIACLPAQVIDPLSSVAASQPRRRLGVFCEPRPMMSGMSYR
jgi:hypothetical protein